MLEKKNNVIKWTYQLDLYKNPTMAKNLCVLSSFICIMMFSLSLLVESSVSGANLETFLSVLKTQLIFAIGLFILMTICYLAYCKYMMGKYIVSYRMDNEGIENIKEKQPVNKTKLIGLILSVFGMNNKKGLSLSVNDNLYTDFKQVKKIVERRKDDLIIVRSKNNNNQIFVDDKDYDEVLQYLKERISKNK